MDLPSVDSCLENWNELGADFKTLETVNKDYLTKLEELIDVQSKCVKELNHQRYRVGIIKRSLRRLHIGEDDAEKVASLRKEIEKRDRTLFDIEQTLPKPNGMYLKIILGNVNVSILNKNDKFKYKDEYEKFKLILSAIGFLLSVANLCINLRVLELSLMFLLVWYYCTLTIRESILKVNGSKIKGWWRLHHFISTAASAFLLVWPVSSSWTTFRFQFMVFNVYISVVQYLQFRYQQGVLYRLKALGERHNMDITIEGFHSWMWRGLGFLLPFLFAGYLFQLYNAYKLYELSIHSDAPWQVPVLSVLFFALFLGNTITTSMVIPQKIHEIREHREQRIHAYPVKNNDSARKTD
ncbi:transmembrane protein 120 homolog [Halyomorpha halys]|uniref:transmembrane protein 120 homolog n=1 Tax=Halyomorpha halys TaxID=286706 RepID=UPI0006D4E93A|nr:transmembrane protein 120 homolog [Halyomorpha halys]